MMMMIMMESESGGGGEYINREGRKKKEVFSKERERGKVKQRKESRAKERH